VGVIVGVSVMEGVRVMVGVREIVGVVEIVGVIVIVGVSVWVSVGGKKRYIIGSACVFNKNAIDISITANSNSLHPRTIFWRRIRKNGISLPFLNDRIPVQIKSIIAIIVMIKAVCMPVRMSSWKFSIGMKDLKKVVR
jgi:hypothetical protein